MPTHTIGYIGQALEDESFGDESYDEEDYGYVEEEDALITSTWILNLEGLKLTASTLLSDTIIAPNIEEAEKAFKQEFSDASHHPRRIMLKGYSDAVHCRFKPFLDLPYELRQNIWDLAMRAEEHSSSSGGYWRSFHLEDRLEVRNYMRNNTVGTSPHNPSFLPKACRVSKFTQKETLEVFLHGKMFQVCAIRQNRFMHSLLGLAPAGFESVRRLQFAFFDCFPAGFDLNADLELAASCPGLQEMQISFHDSQLYCSRFVNSDYMHTPRPVNEMWDYYKIDRLLDFGVRFKKVTILRKGHGNQLADYAALDLARFVTLKFQEEKGRHVEAKVLGNKFVHSLDD
jgi:hypothetical protein